MQLASGVIGLCSWLWLAKSVTRCVSDDQLQANAVSHASGHTTYEAGTVPTNWLLDKSR